jgi:hypothetical protein
MKMTILKIFVFDHKMSVVQKIRKDTFTYQQKKTTWQTKNQPSSLYQTENIR